MRLSRLIAVFAAFLCAAPAAAVMPEDGWFNEGDLVNVAKLKAATALIQGENFPTAMRLLLQVVRSDPDNSDGWTLLGYSLRRTGNRKDAREAYDRAIRLRPDHIYARQYLGELMLLEGDIPGAEEQRRVIAAECPQGCEPLKIMDQRLEEFRTRGLLPPG